MPAMSPVRRLLLLAAALALVAGGPASADDDDRDHDHERARQAVTDGKALPLGEILSRLQPQIGGEVIEIELEGKGARLVYEIKVLGGDGRLRELYVDAATAEILATKSK